MPRRRFYILTGVAWLLFAVSCATGPQQRTMQEPFTIYLVRHAEKAAETGDPALSRQGVERADWLASKLARRGIEALWSTAYRRTRDTAAPLGRLLGLNIDSYDPAAQAAFAGRLLTAGRSALVVGHSNTIPELASLLCECVATPLGHTDYDRLYVVSIDRHGRRLIEARQQEFFEPGAQP